MSKIKFTPFLPTQTNKIVDKSKFLNEKHVRLSKSMIFSEAFRSLHATAIKLYLALRLKYYKEEEQGLDFPYAKSLGVKHLGLSNNSEHSIRRGLKELCEKGFIEPTCFSKGGGKNNKKPNRYKFSTNWKTYSKSNKNI